MLVNSNAMRLGDNKLISPLVYPSPSFLKKRQDATLTSDVEQVSVLLECQHIRSLSHGLYREHLHVVQHIEHKQDVIAITGDKGKMRSLISVGYL